MNEQQPVHEGNGELDDSVVRGFPVFENANSVEEPEGEGQNENEEQNDGSKNENSRHRGFRASEKQRECAHEQNQQFESEADEEALALGPALHECVVLDLDPSDLDNVPVDDADLGQDEHGDGREEAEDAEEGGQRRAHVARAAEAHVTMVTVEVLRELVHVLHGESSLARVARDGRRVVPPVVVLRDHLKYHDKHTIRR